MISICVKSNNTKVLNNIILTIEKNTLPGISYSRHSFKIFDNIIIHYSGKDIDKFYMTLAQLLYKQIILYYEPLLVMRLLNTNYFYFDDSDIKVIIDEFNLLKEKKIYNYKFVKKKIMEELINFLTSNKIIVLYGFINFRLSSYTRYLENIVNESVNQYLIDREYVRFVNLLKSYVESQIPFNKCYHLIYSNSNAILLSNDGNIIELERIKSKYVSDISFSQNDLVLNTLVSNIPQKIIVHLISPRDQFIKTIEMIFSNQVEMCEGCSLCNRFI